ncbi:MAG: bifunctional acetaldehyde-CoA/alcohol dehydrogenase [Phycisphaerae bacterium]
MIVESRTETDEPAAEDTPAPRQIVRSAEDLDAMIDRVRDAQQRYARFAQEKVDAIFRAGAMAANALRIDLAKLAARETGMGIAEDKVIKNHFASEFIYNKFKDTRTCGLIERDETFGIRKIAEPVGVLAGIVPTTNPTSTAIFKALIALKTRNAIIFSPHPRATECTIAAARAVLNAAVDAGAPAGIIEWIDQPSVDLSKQLMKHPKVNMILATGGPGMVKAAYSSGKPAIGVGAGNTPAVIDETADIPLAVNSVLLSKTFDNGMICASEQSVIVAEKVYAQVRDEFLHRGAYLVNDEQREALGRTIVREGKLNAKIVGQPAAKIAEMAGFTVPEDTKVLIAEVTDVGTDEPFSYEKLSPVLAMYRADGYTAAVEKARDLVTFGGMGHTSVLYTDPANSERIETFGRKMETGRVLINQPSSHGAIGDIYNFRLEPSLTLGCGSWGGNSVSENVGAQHLLNIKTVSERRENMLWFRVPPKVYFKRGCLPIALGDVADRKRAFIVTDKPLYDLGIVDKVTDVLDELGIETDVFYEVQPDPDLATVRKGVARMNAFGPDLIIPVGGGSPMDAAKIMWLLYEHPEEKFEDLAMRFMDIRKRVYQFPKLGEKAQLVAIPTTSGTGSEVTPFAVVTDEKTGRKYPIADYELTPDMAICDADLVMTMPRTLTAHSGIDALTHALEAVAAVTATDYTNGMALEAIRILMKYLPAAYGKGAADAHARERVHNASTMAGMAFANGFLGLCHSMAHKLGAMFHLPHGLANALLINEVIRFNATDNPRKQTAFPQYEYPNAKQRYARVADYLQLGGATADEKVRRLTGAIDDLKRRIDIPANIAEAGVDEAEFTAALEELSEMAFDDQCTGANPRYPLMKEIAELYRKAYRGNVPAPAAQATEMRA